MHPWENQEGNNVTSIICVSRRWNEWVQTWVRERVSVLCESCMWGFFYIFCMPVKYVRACMFVHVCVKWVRGRCAWCQAQTGSAVVQVQVAVRWLWLVNRVGNYLRLSVWDTGQIPSGYCGKVHLVGHCCVSLLSLLQQKSDLLLQVFRYSIYKKNNFSKGSSKLLCSTLHMHCNCTVNFIVNTARTYRELKFSFPHIWSVKWSNHLKYIQV